MPTDVEEPISWRMRLRSSAAVELVGDFAVFFGSLFCGMLLSSKYSFTRPTWMDQTLRNTSVPLRSTLTNNSPPPSGRVTGVMGSE